VSGTNTESYITPAYPHLEGAASGCQTVATTYNVPAVVCDNTVQIRQVKFFEMGPSNLLLNQAIKVARVDPVTKANITTLPSSAVSVIVPDTL